LNPRSRKQIHVIAQALALQQTHARLPEPLRARLSAAVEELERHVGRIRAYCGGSTADTTRRVETFAAGARRRILSIWLSPISAAPPGCGTRGGVFRDGAIRLADEIQLKDGKKLYGVIVAYEDNMFKVKTDFGYVLVEKDKILKIIPSTPAGKSGPQPTAKKDAAATFAKANCRLATTG